MGILFCIVAVAFLWCAVCIVRNNSPKSTSRLINAAIAIIALTLLIFFNIPWAEISFNQFSSEEELYLKVVFKGKGGVSTGRLLAAVNRPH